VQDPYLGTTRRAQGAPAQRITDGHRNRVDVKRFDVIEHVSNLDFALNALRRQHQPVLTLVGRKSLL
jgi:hypothetical protein